MRFVTKGKKGFTLVEMMLVVAFIVLIVSVITVDVIGNQQRANAASSALESQQVVVSQEARTGEESLAALGF